MLWSALLFGLVGSFHCVGMCGPIALSIPMDLSTRLRLMGDAVAYNLGRVATYSLIGLVIGSFGHWLFTSGYQQWLSLEVGVLILVLYFLPRQLSEWLMRYTGLGHVHTAIKKTFGQLLQKPGREFIFLIGMLNGLLPCGFVYMAAAAAVLAGSPAQSAAYMALFGLGTAPIMFITATSRQFVTIKFRQRIKVLKPYLATAVALLFILRGLALGIPYISPKLPSAVSAQPTIQEAVCHPH
ncbi:MAG: sulfite exporter TauE/SafE family protein [Bernardetiaceae bacterium]|nr:sulfite exporter TauE/SafE family protein [Bernardetiaceae bacterium]